MAFWANCLSTIAAHHHAVLDFVLILLHHLEEGINRNLFMNVLVAFRWKSMPEHVLLFACQIVVWLEYGEVIAGSTPAKLLAPYAHLVAMPALYASIVDAQ